MADTVGTKSLLHLGPLARLLYPVRFHLAGCVVLSTAGAAAGLAPYIAVAEIARTVVNTTAIAAVTTDIWNWVIIGTTGALLRLILVFASSRLGHYADAETLHHIRVRIVRHLGALPMGWFRAAGSGSVKKVMTNDLEEMHQLIAHALGEITGAYTAIIVSFGYLVLIDWRMALITMGVLAGMVLFFQVAMRSATTHMTNLINAETRISAASVEYADGITVVKTFGTGGLIDRFATAVAAHTRALRAWVEETKYSSAGSRLLASEMSVFAAVLLAGLALVYAGQLSIAALLPFLIVGIGLPTSIVPAVHGAQGLRKGRMSAAHVEDLLSRKPLPEPDHPTPPLNGKVEFDNVSFAYKDTNYVLKDINAVCEPGTVTALVGPSGAGKSTLAALIPRFYDVSDGAIRLGEVDIRKIGTTTLLSAVSLVFQDVVLLRDTVIENIRIGKPGASFEAVREAAIAAQIHTVIERLPEGYNTILGTDAAGLSGGERQRLTIARAILSDAPVVILDEATAALDADSEVAVQEALAQLTAGKTVIVIAHRLHTIRNADQIIVLQGGKLMEKGKHQQLLDHKGLYSRMWHAQEEGAAS